LDIIVASEFDRPRWFCVLPWKFGPVRSYPFLLFASATHITFMKNYLSRWSSSILAVALFLSGSGFIPPDLQAATFNIADSDVLALISAINSANGNGQDDTINLATGGSYSLTSVNNSTDGPNGLPVITADGGRFLNINGNGALLSRSSAGGTPDFRIINVGSAKVTISGLVISNGRVVGGVFPEGNSGAGIFNRGTLTVQNCTISGNSAVTNSGNPSTGGGIFNYSGTLLLTKSTVRDNSAAGLDDFEGGDGGGIYNFGGTVTLTATTIDGNLAAKNNATGGGSGGGGGGLANSDGTMTIRTSTLSSNAASLAGGGILNFSGSLTVVNSTLSNNVTEGSGGAIHNQSQSQMILTNSTISSNLAIGSAGGINTFGSVAQIRNTIVAGNTVSGGSPSADIFSFSGGITSQGHNLIGIADSSSTWIASDLTGTSANPRDPMLTPLANNGGPTQTRALQQTSPAINAGDNAVLNAPVNVNSDQRLFARKVGSAVDIGAFEFGARPVATGDINGDGFTDYVLFNSSSRRTAIWNLQGSIHQGGGYGPTLPSGWTVACVGDFDLDGGRDYVLFNASTRQTAVWFLRNTVLAGSVFGPSLPPGWTLIAAVDFNGDARLDYVLFNPSTGRSAIWHLNGTVFSSSVYGPTLPAGYVLVDALEFNGGPDFLLFNPTSKRTAIWYLNFTSFFSSAYGPTLPAGWTLQGAADFNSDGQPDYVLYHASTRRTAHWYLNGAMSAGSAYGPTLAAGYSLAFP
jgi:hypothetical protein